MKTASASFTYTDFLETLKSPVWEKAVVSMQRFVSSCGASATTSDAQDTALKFVSFVDLLVDDFISHPSVCAAEVIDGNEDNEQQSHEQQEEEEERGPENSSSLRVAFYEYVERLLATKLSSFLESVLQTTTAEEKEFTEKLRWLNLWIQPRHLELPDTIDDLLQERSAQDDLTWYELGRKQLTSLVHAKYPRSKLIYLLNAYRISAALAACLKQSTRGQKTESALIAADDLLPVLIWLILRTQPTNLLRSLDFVACFRHPSLLVSQDLYEFTMISSAAEYLKRLEVARDLKVDDPTEQRSLVLDCPKASWIGQEHWPIHGPIIRLVTHRLSSDLQGEALSSSEARSVFSVSVTYFTINVYNRFLELLKQPASNNTVVILKRFVDTALTLDQQTLKKDRLPEQLSPDRFHNIISATVRTLMDQASLATWNALFEEPDTMQCTLSERRFVIQVMLTECAERFLFGKLYHILFPKLITLTFGGAAGSTFARAREHLELDKIDSVPSLAKPEAAVVRQLTNIDNCMSPLEKLRIFLALVRCGCDTNAPATPRSVAIIGWLLLRANPLHLEVNLSFVAAYRHPVLNDGVETCQCIKLIQLAIVAVKKLSPHKCSSIDELMEKLESSASKCVIPKSWTATFHRATDSRAR